MDDQNLLDKTKLSDHDLMIILHTQMARMQIDLGTIGKDMTGQIKELQLLKHDKEAALVIKVDTDNALRDHEKRLRRIERYVFMALGALTLIQIYIGGRISNLTSLVQTITPMSIVGK